MTQDFSGAMVNIKSGTKLKHKILDTLSMLNLLVAILDNITKKLLAQKFRHVPKLEIGLFSHLLASLSITTYTVTHGNRIKKCCDSGTCQCYPGVCFQIKDSFSLMPLSEQAKIMDSLLECPICEALFRDRCGYLQHTRHVHMVRT